MSRMYSASAAPGLTVFRRKAGLLHGSPDANANELTDHRGCDPILATASLRSGVSRVRPIVDGNDE